MGHLDFDAARKERLRERDLEPITFTLGGRTFRCRSSFPLIDVWSGAPEAPPEITAGTTTAMGVLLLNVARTVADHIVPEQRGEWWAMFSDESEIVQGIDIQHVLKGLQEEYAGRPTSPPDASSNGQRAGAAADGLTSSSTPEKTSGETSST